MECLYVQNETKVTQSKEDKNIQNSKTTYKNHSNCKRKTTK